jgi:hypothetical protein
MISTGTKNIGHGEFVGEFLYQLYRTIAPFGYNSRGEFDPYLLTDSQWATRHAYDLISGEFDDAAHDYFGRTSEFSWACDDDDDV